MKTYLIADSGGTQTDWCFIDENANRHFFTTPSFHPVNWNDEFIEEYQTFFNTHFNYFSAQVHFYGAGCLQESNRSKIKDIFLNWGFSQVHIFSDIEGACHAALGVNQGVVAILGTGSVVCEYNGDEIKNIRGGFGFLLGDEGSGYHFGKLFLNKFLNNEIPVEYYDQLTHVIGDRSSILSNVYGVEGKLFISSISSKLGELNSYDFVKEIHFENYQIFIEKYILPIVSKEKQFSVIGRYGFVNKEIVTEIANDFGWEIKAFIPAPIAKIVDYVLSDR